MVAFRSKRLKSNYDSFRCRTLQKRAKPLVERRLENAAASVPAEPEPAEPAADQRLPASRAPRQILRSGARPLLRPTSAAPKPAGQVPMFRVPQAADILQQKHNAFFFADFFHDGILLEQQEIQSNSMSVTSISFFIRSQYSILN